MSYGTVVPRLANVICSVSLTMRASTCLQLGTLRFSPNRSALHWIWRTLSEEALTVEMFPADSSSDGSTGSVWRLILPCEGRGRVAG